MGLAINEGLTLVTFDRATLHLPENTAIVSGCCLKQDNPNE